MGQANCLSCDCIYTRNNPPKILINCQHRICLNCLKMNSTCPVDGSKIDLKRYKIYKFHNDKQLLLRIQKGQLDDPESWSDEVNEFLLPGELQRTLNPSASITSIHNLHQFYDSLPPIGQSPTKPKQPQNRPKRKERAYGTQPIHNTEPILCSESVQFIEQMNRSVDSKEEVEAQYQQKTAYSRELSYKTQKNEILKDQEVCLLHSRPIELICICDNTSICSTCALFGSHKGHNVIPIEQYLKKMSNLTDQAIIKFEEIKEKENNFNKQTILNYIEGKIQNKREKQYSKIKKIKEKIHQAVMQAEKKLILNLQNQLEKQKSNLNCKCIENWEDKKNNWFSQVATLGTVMECLYNQKINEGVSYIDQKNQKSRILQRGKNLLLECKNMEKYIKDKVKNQIEDLQLVENLDSNYINFGEYKHSGLNVGRMSEDFSKGQDKTFGYKSPNGEEFLLEVDTKMKEDSNELQSNNSLFFSKKPSIKNLKKLDAKRISNPCQTSMHASVSMRRSSSKTNKMKIGCNLKNTCSGILKGVGNISNRNSIGPVQRNTQIEQQSQNDRTLHCLNQSYTQRGKKLDIPQKYRQTYFDLIADRLQVIDFSGAELGDGLVMVLCKYVSRSSKAKSLKLIRNKLTDQSLWQIMNACIKSNIQSLNLSQNNLTQKSLEALQKFEKGSVRNITLSQNKINLLNVKHRLAQLRREGFTVTV